MDNQDFDQLHTTYKQASDRWVEAIQAEEALATPDHSMKKMERWDDAGFNLQDAESAAKKRVTRTRMLCGKTTTVSDKRRRCNSD